MTGRLDLHHDLDRDVQGLFIVNSSPGIIYKNLLIMGSKVDENTPAAPGHIRAYDVITGKRKWIFHTIPLKGEFGYDTWPPDAYLLAGGANAWAGVTVDTKHAMVFAATGSAAFDFYGVTRHGDNLFANCVLALDARTGRRVWHFQALKHDIWDWDFPAPPTLVTVTHNGRRIDAVAQVTKFGDTFVLDRRTGESLFPIQYRKAPPSSVDGEQAAEAQPYPVKPPPFARHGGSGGRRSRRMPMRRRRRLKRWLIPFRNRLRPSAPTGNWLGSTGA